MSNQDSFIKTAFATPTSAIASLAILLAGAYAVIPLAQWIIFDAVWTGSSGADCKGKGACWIFISHRFEQIIYGSYPTELRWRVEFSALFAILGVALLSFLPAKVNKIKTAAIFFGIYTVATGILLRGGTLGLEGVPTRLWGGLMLTAIIAAWTIATAVPLGLVLALGRRSHLPVISRLSAIFIDTTRSLPLVGLLFLVIVMFPFFMPPGVETDRLIRALAAFTMFNAANLAEVFRGGLQTVSKGQSEAGSAVGLSRSQVTWRIVVPQAVYISLPGIVNVCIAIVKETTIVLIVGLFDFLGILQAGLSDPNWIVAEQARATAYVFAAAIFWVTCFGLSKYSLHLEQKMNPQRR